MTIVDTNAFGQPVEIENPREFSTNGVERWSLDDLDRQHETAERITHREWLDAISSSRFPPTLEVRRPLVVA